MEVTLVPTLAHAKDAMGAADQKQEGSHSALSFTSTQLSTFSAQTCRQTQAGHDGADPADALRRASKLVLKSYKEDPEALQRPHHEDIYLLAQKHKNKAFYVTSIKNHIMDVGFYS